MVTYANRLRGCIGIPRNLGISHDLLLEAADALDIMESALIRAETVMATASPRGRDTKEYLAALDQVRAAVAGANS